MNLRDDPNYFPQPDVPNNGNYGSSFGREQLYYDYLPRSAAIEAANAAAGEKTYSSGKYTYNPATGQYTWVPAGTVASNLGGNAGTGVNAGSDRGGNDGITSPSTPNWSPAANLGAFLTDKGLTSIGGYLSQAAREGRSAQQETPTDPQESSRDDVSGTNGLGGKNAAQGGGSTGESWQGNEMSGGVDPTAPAGGYGVGNAPSGDNAKGGMISSYALGGLGSLGGYSDGGRLLRGPGDGVSDSIPATIGKAKQPARLADGEFVVPSRIVSELGNGSTEAGARKLYAMLARIQAGRKKSIGTNKVAVNSRMDKHLPA